MKSVWDHFYIDIPKRMGAIILLTIHDAQQHIGEESRLWAASEKRLFRLADHIAVLSGYAGETLRQRIGDFRPIHVVAPGLVMNPAPPGPAKPTPRDRPLKFLFFGRIRKYKGLDLVLDAWRMLQARNEASVHLTIAGSGDIAEYSAAISSLKDVELIHGWTSDETMSRLFASHDVNLLPYLEGSTSATSLAGMWAGMPSIATPIAGFEEQLVHGDNALIMRDISAEALAECVLEIAASPDLYGVLAQGAHQRAQALSAPVVVGNWHNLYERIWRGRAGI
jgi:glycosyltransferase involved in cell wall biosynthesis